MKRILYYHTKFISGSFFACLVLLSCESKPTHLKPNIIIIMADDLGYGGVGCFGNKTINTPNIDDLARNGIRFTDFHSNGSVCTPTRAALLTGNYQQKSGLEGVIYARGDTRNAGLDTSQVTIAKLLKENGYATGIMGKWHLGYKQEFNPVHHGFDEFYGYVSGNIDYHSHYDGTGIYDWWHNLNTFEEEGYSTDLITKHSVNFINENSEKPFFLYVPHESPHVPFQGPEDPAYRFSDNEFTYYGPVEDRIRAYKEMVEVMDEGVGTIMKALKRNNIEDNTLVFFISDNGAEKFGHNGVLNGSKISLLEGGHRVPAIAYWKNRIKTRESSETLMTMDLLPTILSVTKSKVNEPISFDGLDFSNLLFKNDVLKERNLFWRYLNQKAVRKNEWKLLITESDTALYNLSLNIGETKNVLSTHRQVAKNLLEALKKWEDDIGPTDKMITQK